MITLYRQGNYQLFETNHNIKILKLNDQSYAWPYVKNIGEILVLSETKFDPVNCHRITSGRYRLYKVRGEPTLTDLQHLELSVGGGLWQGYLLLTGLPTHSKQRSRIIPTDEIITYHHPYNGPFYDKIMKAGDPGKITII